MIAYIVCLYLLRKPDIKVVLVNLYFFPQPKQYGDSDVIWHCEIRKVNLLFIDTL